MSFQNQSWFIILPLFWIVITFETINILILLVLLFFWLVAFVQTLQGHGILFCCFLSFIYMYDIILMFYQLQYICILKFGIHYSFYQLAHYLSLQAMDWLTYLLRFGLATCKLKYMSSWPKKLGHEKCNSNEKSKSSFLDSLDWQLKCFAHQLGAGPCCQ